MELFADLIAQIRGTNRREPHIDPVLERAAKDLLEPSMESRSKSLALALQDAFDDWLDDEERLDKAEQDP